MRSLSIGGAVVAAAAGAVALRAGWSWGALLLVWFAVSSALSHLGRSRKARRTNSIVEKGAQRDHWQVLANGGVFALAAACTAFKWGNDEWTLLYSAAGVGALSAAAADTWATEVGTLIGGEPWSLSTRAHVPAGTSGAVTLAGTIALLAGAVVTVIAAVALAVLPASFRLLLLISAAGVFGALVDTMLGAWLQQRRWCRVCAEYTERRRHVCGAATEQRSGIALLDNDAVNFLCTVAGALAAFVTLRLA